MNTICSQCGSVLAPGEHACSFCDDSSGELPLADARSSIELKSTASAPAGSAWRGELNQRVQAYRARRRKAPSEGQSALPFNEYPHSPCKNAAVEVREAGSEPCPSGQPEDGFAFTIAIGRIAQKPEEQDPRLLIDVSVPPQTEVPMVEPLPESPRMSSEGVFPKASLDERKRALLIDAGCLAFAFGGFLALFGSLGGHFTLDKLSAAVCFFTFAFVYIQYFGLFTVFGGNTPGMLVCGLQVASFTGDQPTPRQYALRALGYLLSAGTCFLGFLWVLWDEEGLTWHDRISRTYLANLENLSEEDLPETVTVR